MKSHIFEKTFWAATLTFVFIVTGACGKTPTTQVGAPNPPGGGNGPEGKPTTGVAPQFTEAQLKIGQWIEWKKTDKNGKSECVRWTVANFLSSGIKLEGRFSRSCETPDDYMVEHILFQPDTGLVVEDQIITPASSKPGALLNKTIYNHLYGNKNQVEFLIGKLYTNAEKKHYYPVFQLKGQSQAFLNDAQSPFHAFVLAWSETISGNTWTYQFNASNPPIESIPVRR